MNVKLDRQFQRFEYVDEKSSKFWEVRVAGTSVDVRYGKIGTTGQSLTKEFDDEIEAHKHAEKLMREKLKGGYVSSIKSTKSQSAPAKSITAVNELEKETKKKPQGSAKQTGAVWRKVLVAISKKDNSGLRKIASAKDFTSLPADSRLLVACILGDYDFARSMLQAGADPNRSFAEALDGSTPLVATVRMSRSLEVTQLLLDAGADINAIAGEKGLGAFGWALYRLEVNLAEQLFVRGAEPNFGSDIWLPLVVAEQGSLAFVRALEEKGCKLDRDNGANYHFFYRAAQNDDPKVFDYLLNRLSVASSGCTPLMLAALFNRHKLIRRFLERGDDASVRDNDGETALSRALKKGNTKAVSALREFHVEKKDFSAPASDAAMLKAADDGALETILKLRDEGISVNVEDEQGNTPIILVVKAGHRGIVQQLYDLGADVNHRNNVGETALAIAQASDSTDIANNLTDILDEQSRNDDSYASIEPKLELLGQLLESDRIKKQVPTAVRK